VPAAAGDDQRVERRAAGLDRGVGRDRQPAGGLERAAVEAEDPDLVAALAAPALLEQALAPASTSSGPVMSRLWTPGKARIATWRGRDRV
jgi:hypothetical protein